MQTRSAPSPPWGEGWGEGGQIFRCHLQSRLNDLMDAVDGFLTANDDARARPVGVAIAKDGALLLGDDVGNTVCLRSPPRAEPSASAPLPKFVIHESTSRPNSEAKGH